MRFKYSEFNSIGCCKKNNICVLVKIITYFKKGGGLIYYKNYLDKNILNTIKFIIFYFNIDFSFYDIYFKVEPQEFKFYDTCLDLSIFFSIFFAFFKLNMKRDIIILGGINFKSGKILPFGNFANKIDFIRKKLINLIILSGENNFFFNEKNFISVLKFNYLYEIYYFFKRCLAQRKSIAITRRESGVRLSQYLKK